MTNCDDKSVGINPERLMKFALSWCSTSEKEQRISIQRERLSDILEGKYPSFGTKLLRIISAYHNDETYDPNNDAEFPARPGAASELTTDELLRLETCLVSGIQENEHSLGLQQIRIELFRRKVGGIDGMDVVRQICRLCVKSYRDHITYATLSRALWPRQTFEGHGEGSRIKQALDAAMLFCVENDLPLMNTLVVSRVDHKLSKRDVQTIHETARHLCVDVGSDPDSYIREETEAARDIYFSAGRSQS